jgi:hypothetical protein
MQPKQFTVSFEGSQLDVSVEGGRVSVHPTTPPNNADGMGDAPESGELDEEPDEEEDEEDDELDDD